MLVVATSAWHRATLPHLLRRRERRWGHTLSCESDLARAKVPQLAARHRRRQPWASRSLNSPQYEDRPVTGTARCAAVGGDELRSGRRRDRLQIQHTADVVVFGCVGFKHKAAREMMKSIWSIHRAAKSLSTALNPLMAQSHPTGSAPMRACADR